MKIEHIETYTVSVDWKNWLFVAWLRTAACMVSAKPLSTVSSRRPRPPFTNSRISPSARIPARSTRSTPAFSKPSRMPVTSTAWPRRASRSLSWEYLGKSLGATVWQLLGGKVRDSVLAYANGWYRAERTPEAFVRIAESVVAQGFQALKLDPFGTRAGSAGRRTWMWPTISSRRAREVRPRTEDHDRRPYSLCAQRGAEHRAAAGPAGYLLVGGADDCQREELTNQVAAQCPIPVATGEQFDKIGRFETLARAATSASFSPKPMSLGGIANTIAVANLARANGA